MAVPAIRNRSDIIPVSPSSLLFFTFPTMATFLKKPLKLALVQLASGLDS